MADCRSPHYLEARAFSLPSLDCEIPVLTASVKLRIASRRVMNRRRVLCPVPSFFEDEDAKRAAPQRYA
jgi:hypothetical protein